MPFSAQASSPGGYQIKDLAAPLHGPGFLQSVSCVSDGNCVAVGSDSSSDLHFGSIPIGSEPFVAI